MIPTIYLILTSIYMLMVVCLLEAPKRTESLIFWKGIPVIALLFATILLLKKFNLI